MKPMLPLLLVLLVPAGAALAQEPPPGPLAQRPVVEQALTVEEAVELALQESPVVRGAVEEVEAALARLRAMEAERRPWLSANLFASGGSMGHTVASPPAARPQMLMGLSRGAFVDGNLMLMYPLLTGGRLEALAREAAALRGAAGAELETQRQEVALLARLAYRQTLARRALVEVWRARLEEDEERLRLDRLRLEQGQIPELYVLRGEAELAATRQELTNAERDVELALLQLKTVLGVHPASRLELAEPLAFEPSAELLERLIGGEPARLNGQEPGLPPEAEALLRLAEQRRPELRAAGERVAAADAGTSAARSSFRPQVNLFAMGDAGLSRGDPMAGIAFGAVASLPLSNGGQRRALVDAAEAEQRQRERQREQAALVVAQEVVGAFLELRAAERNVETARAALASSEEDYRVAQLRYQAGRSVPVEVLDALAAHVRAESGVVQALFEYNIARDRLLRAVGEPEARGS